MTLFMPDAVSASMGAREGCCLRVCRGTISALIAARFGLKATATQVQTVSTVAATGLAEVGNPC
ncbi:hypothetical protein NRB_51010 [Novosphingobium sp. 11B]